jgi:hypothetical protein
MYENKGFEGQLIRLFRVGRRSNRKLVRSYFESVKGRIGSSYGAISSQSRFWIGAGTAFESVRRVQVFSAACLRTDRAFITRWLYRVLIFYKYAHSLCVWDLRETEFTAGIPLRKVSLFSANDGRGLYALEDRNRTYYIFIGYSPSISGLRTTYDINSDFYKFNLLRDHRQDVYKLRMI